MANIKALPDKWADYLISQPETGMGYWVANITLRDKRIFKRVVINGGIVTQIYGLNDVPFDIEEIEDIRVTHDKWNFNDEQNST